MTIDRLVIRWPSDMHAHPRRDALLQAVLPASARQMFYVLAMPNPKPSIYKASDVIEYRAEIKAAPGGDKIEPVMSIYITPATTAQDIYDAHDVGTRNGKIYPKDLTTNAEDGVENYFALRPIYAAMQKCGMVLSLHGELPGKWIHALDRERRFLPIVEWIAINFPNLKIVLEHITTKSAVKFVLRAGPNVASTITLHHLLTFFNDIVEPKLHPHLFCKPLAKRYSDMQALIWAALSGNPKFFLGSDTAPHLRSMKECAECCAGVYTAEWLIQQLAEFFIEHRAPDKLENYASVFGPLFYGLELPMQRMTLERGTSVIPALYPVPGLLDDGLVPFRAGKEVTMQIV